MVPLYTQSRLLEAYAIIGEDKARRQREEDDKKARTTYRDDIQTRADAKGIKYSSLQQEDSDHHDGDYHPLADHKKTKDKTRKSDEPVDIEKKPKRSLKPKVTVLLPSPCAVFNSFGPFTADNLVKFREIAWRNTTPGQMIFGQKQNDEDEIKDSKSESSSATSKPKEPFVSYLRNGKVRRDVKRKRESSEIVTQPISSKGKEVLRPTKRRRGDSDPNRDYVDSVRGPIPVIHFDDFSTACDLHPEYQYVAQSGTSPSTAIYISDTEDAPDTNTTQRSDTNNRKSALAQGPQHGSNQGQSHATNTNDDDDKDTNTSNIDPLITTSFAHPIDFKAKDYCDFCRDYRFGITGYMPMTTAMAYSAVDNQYIELGDGHAAHHRQTKMCIPCALRRLQIARCTTHIFTRHPLPQEEEGEDRDPNHQHTTDWHAYNREIADFLNVVNGQHQDFRPLPSIRNPCHLCAAPALWACSAYQLLDECLQPCRIPHIPVDVQLEQIAERYPDLGVGEQLQEPMVGCGLKVCHRCWEFVRTRCNGKLDEELVREGRLKQSDTFARADVEFLFHGSLLWKAYHGKRDN